MTEDTQAFKKRDRIFNTSTRGWIAVIVVVTICVMGLIKIEVKEPLYTIGIAAVSFYFGQNTKQTTPTQPTP